MSKFCLVCLTLMLLFSAANSHAALDSRAYERTNEYLTFDASVTEIELEPQPGKVGIQIAKLEGKLCTYTGLSFGLKKSKEGTKFTELVIEKAADGNVSKLSLACLIHGIYKTVNLSTVDQNGKLVRKIALQNVSVKSVEYIGEAGDSSARITLTFEKVIFNESDKEITVEQKSGGPGQ